MDAAALQSCVHLSRTGKKKMKPVCGNRRRSGEQRTRGKQTLCWLAKGLLSLCSLCLTETSSQGFFPSNLEIILIYFKPSIKTSHAAVAGWLACARTPGSASKGLLPSSLDTAVNYCVFNYI